MKKRKWFGIAFLLGAILSSHSVLANTNVIPATITVQDETLAASISPSTLTFRPEIGQFSTNEITIQNTGQVPFYPSVAFIGYSDDLLVEERGIGIYSSDSLLFKAGTKRLDTSMPITYPNGRSEVAVGSTYTVPLSVGAGHYMPNTSDINLSFDIEVTLDRIMENVENINSSVNESSVSLTWDPFVSSEGITATRYRIVAYKKNAATQEFEKYSFERVSNTTSFTWSGLDLGTDYQFEIIPSTGGSYINKALGSIDVNIPTVAVGGDTEIIEQPTQVQNFQYTINGSIATFTWDTLAEATRYRVSIEKKAIGATTFGSPLTYSATTTTLNRTLASGFDYRVKVIPQTGGTYDSTKASTPIEFTIE